MTFDRIYRRPWRNVLKHRADSKPPIFAGRWSVFNLSDTQDLILKSYTRRSGWLNFFEGVGLSKIIAGMYRSCMALALTVCWWNWRLQLAWHVTRVASTQSLRLRGSGRRRSSIKITWLHLTAALYEVADYSWHKSSASSTGGCCLVQMSQNEISS